MGERTANVTSLDAIESFRSSLIVYLSKARPTLEEVSTEVARTRSWLQNDQRVYWERQMRSRARDLETAQAELFSARLSTIQNVSASQEMALHRAQRAMRECETKLRLLKKWDRELENRSEPLVRQVDQLHGFITGEMVKATSFLTEVLKSLQAYAEMKTPGLQPASSSASEPAVAEQETAAASPTPGEETAPSDL
jgi:hypothetical protein